MSTAPRLTVAASFPTTVRGEPVGLATLGCGRACRSSGSAIAAELSGAFEASDLRKHNRSKREYQSQE
jgi:hypothetical protein